MKAVYVSYDGVLDPLGASQVVPYLEGLAERGVRTTLLSFEKPERFGPAAERESMGRRLEERAISWRPLSYHKRPRLPATLWDVWRGSRLLRDVVGQTGARLVHCRGDVSMAIARFAGLPEGVRLLYDVRGFFSDERVETGSWRRGSLLDRAVRRVEAGNLARADAIIVLTRAAREALRGRRPDLESRVIPTCVDTEAFHPGPPGEVADYGLVYCGSLGTWYMASEMVAFAKGASLYVPGRVLFLTPQAEEARRAGATPDWAEVRSVPPAEVPGWLRRGRALFFFIRPTPAKRASCPTKLGEGLATGLPVVANRGIGDLDTLLEEKRVGILIEGFSEAAYTGALGRLRTLLLDTETRARCRSVALEQFSLQSGVTAYHEVYRSLERGGRHE